MQRFSLLFLLCAGFALRAPEAAAQAAWTTWGNGLGDTSSAYTAKGPQQLSPATVKNLKVKWFFSIPVGGGSTPTVEPGGLYYVSASGFIYKLNPTTGALLWSNSVPRYIGANHGAAATSPAIASDRIVLALAGYVFALDKSTGKLIWSTLVDANPYASVHSSPVIVGNTVLTGVASSEESVVESISGYIPVFRGSAVALDLTTGAIKWQFYTTPKGYAGAAIWGSSPAVDTTHGLAFFTTGNNYAVPNSVGACIRAAKTNVSQQRACLDPTDYVDSILALNLDTGALVWSRATIGADAWLPLTICATQTVLYCPTIAKPMDVDFAQGPIRMSVSNFTGVPDDRGGTSEGYILGAGQKTSVFWGLNPLNGGLYWSAKVATQDGELKWSSAGDHMNNMFYAALNSQSRKLTNNLVGRNGVPVLNWVGGSWAGIDATTGKIVFQIPVVGQALDAPAYAGQAPGGFSVTNGGLVFAASTSGVMAAFDKTGYIHWTFTSGGVITGHPALFNDWVYWPVGSNNPLVANTTTGIYAFSIN